MGYILLMGFTVVFAMMFIFWLTHLVIRNAAIVDIGWGLGFILLTMTYLTFGEWNTRSVMMVILIVLWGVRIMVMLIDRIRREEEEDKRYQRLRESWKSNIPLKFFFFFEVQAVLQVIMSIPLLLVCLNPEENISWFEIIGFLVGVLSLYGETLSDNQLKQFKADPAHRGKTCQIGLWRYSRHPNYFFEWMVWMGIYIFACGTPYGWMTFFSPLIILFLVLKVSGVPLAEEQALRSRGDEYRQYQKTTSVFIPLPRRV
jgi:steroid 5-alpha reductase family enzyme